MHPRYSNPNDDPVSKLLFKRDHKVNKKDSEWTPCEICGKELSSKKLMKRHMVNCRIRKKKKEEAPESQLCPYCAKVLKSKSMLESHIKTMHR